VSGAAGIASVRFSGVGVTRSGTRALTDVSFELRRGVLTGLLGPSGSGKSTLMRAMVGVQRHVTGTVDVLGHPAGSAGLRRSVGYLTQSPSVYTDLTVAENLRYFASVLRIPRADRVGEVDRVLSEVDLAPQRRQLVRRLSGGQLSRVSLAAALLGSPELLVLDEPTVGLDPVLRRDLWALFADLAADGRTVLVSSHVMDEATRCDRLLLLRDGRLIADDAPAVLLRRTGAADVERAFLRLVEHRDPGLES
jgi:ABC-2 type transport system ATP-binding protein